MAVIGGATVEVKLRNISSMGALAECPQPLAPGTELTIDIVGVGPVRGVVRWAQSGQFGLQFDARFDLGRLAPKKQTPSATVLRPWYVDQQPQDRAAS